MQSIEKIADEYMQCAYVYRNAEDPADARKAHARMVEITDETSANGQYSDLLPLTRGEWIIR